MNKTLTRRLEAIEKRLNPRVAGLREILIEGGMVPGISLLATFNGHHIEGEPHESFASFRARAIAAAEAEGAEFIVFGGLPLL
jgi:hypothetical protein